MPGAVSIGLANAYTVINFSLKLRRKKALPALTGRPAVALTRRQLADQFGAAQSDGVASSLWSEKGGGQWSCPIIHSWSVDESYISC